MMNKALELIEAVQLFGVDKERIEILIQPQSIVHSMVEFVDGSILAQLGMPDMRLPIAFCLLWPNAEPHDIGALDLAKVGRLEFARPDARVFPALSLGRQALRAPESEGLPSACVILNAANEICVELFLDGRISWTEIAMYVRKAIEENRSEVKAYVNGDQEREVALRLGALTDDECEIILKGCLINYYRG